MNNYKVNIPHENVIEFYKNKILLDWIQNHHPEIIQKAEEFIKDNIKDD